MEKKTKKFFYLTVGRRYLDILYNRTAGYGSPETLKTITNIPEVLLIFRTACVVIALKLCRKTNKIRVIYL